MNSKAALLDARRDMPGDDSNVKVAVRVRPPLPRELGAGYRNVLKVHGDARTITVFDGSYSAEDGGEDDYAGYVSHTYTFDHVYGPRSTQHEVFDTLARDAVMDTLEGYNATVMAYGQTSSGKTYTMEGRPPGDMRGITPRAVESVFEYISTASDAQRRFLVRASYLQIYNEVITDLLVDAPKPLAIRESRKAGVHVEGLSEWVVRSPQEVFGLIRRGGHVRETAVTGMNAQSSRSHAVFIIICEQAFAESPGGAKPARGAKEVKIGKLNLVDLAGSERQDKTGNRGARFAEQVNINKSLTMLGMVIKRLTEKESTHIPYRDSKLTRILQDSLGGNCRTTVIAMVTPAHVHFHETLSTLKFANRVKRVQNRAVVNEDLDQEALLRRYESELKRLRAELAEKNRQVVDKRQLLDLEEQRKRAERDKLTALRVLEQRSREYLCEKQEKRRLEEAIAKMQGNMLVGGSEIVDTSEFKSAVAQEHARIHREYQKKLEDMERELDALGQNRVQVEKHHQLLLKQRDIMVALTARLNERDEAILAIQGELEAYERHQEMLEERTRHKTAALAHLQHLARQRKLIDTEVLGADGSLKWGAGKPRAAAPGRSPEQAHADDPLLADDRISELEGLLVVRDAQLEDVRQKLLMNESVRREFETIIRDRLRDVVRAKMESNATQLSSEAADEKRRELEAQKATLARAQRDRASLVTIIGSKIKLHVDRVAELAGTAGASEVVARNALELQRLVASSAEALGRISYADA